MPDSALDPASVVLDPPRQYTRIMERLDREDLSANEALYVAAALIEAALSACPVMERRRFLTGYLGNILSTLNRRTDA